MTGVYLAAVVLTVVLAVTVVLALLGIAIDRGTKGHDLGEGQ